MSSRFWRFSLLACCLCACSASAIEAADVKLTINTDPMGATIYEGEELKLWGYAPLTLQYPVPRRWKSCVTTKPIRVRWTSGAEASIPAISLCPAVGKAQQVTFLRPTGVPGVEIDGQFAIQLLQARINAAVAVPAPPYVPPQPTHCTSTLIGRQVFTNCY